jgi:hypothetical protein
LKDFKAGLELFNRIAVVAEAENHHPDLHLESYKKGRVEIWTHSIGASSSTFSFSIFFPMHCFAVIYFVTFVFDCYDVLLLILKWS